jgi:3-methyladenine DNA glycosylase AlkD
MTPRRIDVRAKADETSVDTVLTWLEQNATKETRAGMARFGIPSTKAFGVTVGALRSYAKKLGKDHALAQALWKSGWYEARMLAAFVDDPEQVTSQQMDRWAAEFDNWAICDTVCFALFDRTPHAWKKVHAWAGARAEFKKRAAFALLWALSVHDKQAPDRQFLDCLPLIEQGALDERDYVKKGVDMALRAMGKKPRPALREAVVALAMQLSESKEGARAWVGRHALRELGQREAKRSANAPRAPARPRKK